MSVRILWLDRLGSTKHLMDALATAFLGAAYVLASGCGSEPVGTVSGKVTLDGRPVREATVTFQPERGFAVIGVTNDSGEYSLGGKNRMKEVPIGIYQVTVGTYRISVGTDGQPIEHTETIPAIYNTYSNLQRDVIVGHQVINFELLTAESKRDQ